MKTAGAVQFPPLYRSHLFLLISGKYGNLLVGNVRPLHELLSPLHNRDSVVRTVSAVKAPSVDSDKLWTYEEVQSTRHDFLIVQAAVMPTSVLPAPQGNTIMPERARLERSLAPCADWSMMFLAYPFPNILLKLVSWYGRMTVAGLRSISRLAFTVSFRKSYSSSIGYSSKTQRFFTS